MTNPNISLVVPAPRPMYRTTIARCRSLLGLVRPAFGCACIPARTLLCLCWFGLGGSAVATLARRLVAALALALAATILSILDRFRLGVQVRLETRLDVLGQFALDEPLNVLQQLVFIYADQ